MLAVCSYEMYRGCLVLQSNELDDLAAKLSKNIPQIAQDQRCSSRGHSFHITVIPRHEFEQVGTKICKLLEADLLPCTVLSIGIGTLQKESNQSWYSVIHCHEANLYRKRLNLPPKDLHCTLGFLESDIHGPFKGSMTIYEYHSVEYSLSTLRYIIQSIDMCNRNDLEVVNRLWNYIASSDSSTGEFIEDKLVFKLAAYSLKSIEAVEYSLQFIEHLLQKHVIEGMYLYCVALQKCKCVPPGTECADHMFRRLLSISRSQEVWHHCMPENKATTINVNKVNDARRRRRDFILDVLNIHIKSARYSKNLLVFSFKPTSNSLSDCNLENTGIYHLQCSKLPRNFGWISPDKICAGAIPNGEDAYLALIGIGVTDIICLLEQCPSLGVGAAVMGMLNVHYFQVNDRCALSMEDLDCICNILDEVQFRQPLPPASKRVVYVHCHGGVGRTALVLAAHYLRSHSTEGIGPSGAVTDFLVDDCGRTVKLSAEQEARLEEFWRRCQSASYELSDGNRDAHTADSSGMCDDD